uniref:(northern house mosquito) hypothetical protein n=1 Tax=Culex pipiens TaxID=7175 RepID=A0A8D8N2K7_CULPI
MLIFHFTRIESTTPDFLYSTSPKTTARLTSSIRASTVFKNCISWVRRIRWRRKSFRDLVVRCSGSFLHPHRSTFVRHWRHVFDSFSTASRGIWQNVDATLNIVRFRNSFRHAHLFGALTLDAMHFGVFPSNKLSQP